MAAAAPSPRSAPRPPIGWGILGTGQIARRFALDLARLRDARLVAVGSRSESTARLFADRFAVPHRHGSYAALADDPDVQVVYIATPASVHKDNILLCLAAGKAVLCEKPFTLDAREAEEVIAAARHRKVFLMEAMWTRFLPAVVRLRHLLAAGAVGEVRLLIADLGTRLTADPPGRRSSTMPGGGALLQRGVYLVSLASMILGTPTTVRSLAIRGDALGDEHVAVLLGYQGRQLASLVCSGSVLTSRGAVVAGSTGQIRIHEPVHCPSRLTLRQYAAVDRSHEIPLAPRRGALGDRLTDFLKRRPLARRLRERYSDQADRLLHGIRTRNIVAPPVGEGLHYQASEVMRCLRAGRTESEIMPLDESLSVMATIDRILESSRGRGR